VTAPAVIRLWTAAYAGPFDPAWPDVLDAEDRARAERFMPGPRARFVRRRALLRAVLGLVRGEAPAAVPLVRGTYGHLSVPGGPWCSVSSVGAVVAVALAAQPLGLDCEEPRHVPEALEIAESWFPDDVRHALAQAPDADSRDAVFLRAWVRLEALGKAMTLGIADRLRGEPAISPAVETMMREGHRWFVHTPLVPGARYTALAIEAPEIAVHPERLPTGFVAQ
jgi:phosphopantetheinyl transferase